SSNSQGVQQGRNLFAAAGCQNCHGGKYWTISIIDFTPTPGGAVADGQRVKFLCRVGTFDPGLFSDGVSNEIRANNAANVQARGVLGFNVPSLISVFASALSSQSGAAAPREVVAAKGPHQTAGGADHADFLNSPLLRRFLVQFLKSI